MDDQKLSDAVNRSGFPLQIRLEQVIKETRNSHGWRVIFSEHSWVNSSDGGSGFIDLALEDGNHTAVMLIECKRVLDSSWIFLVDDPKEMDRRHVKSWLTRSVDGRTTHFGPHELVLDPSTPQSQYCVVDGQDPKVRPMLERIGSDVVSSVEGFATEETGFLTQETESLRMYFGVIVTTAKLRVCEIDPKKVSLEDGKIEGASFTKFPYVRFRKQMASHWDASNAGAGDGYRGIARAKENTVFVVNAEALPQFLKHFEVDGSSLGRIR